ncbi:MAG TPA: NAD(P)-dependent oxidoreductase [Caldilineaceae bacterium]|nr:NAD(P)-dependent oxidoreductase [Caldilineaceae bacterium]
MHKVVFLTERSPRHQEAARAAAPAAVEVVMLRQPDRQTLLAELADAEFLISERAGVIDAELIAAGPRLRLIQRLGSLAYDIDLDAARRAGVPVAIWPVIGSIMVAEHMIMQMLALVKRLPEVSAIAQAAGDWGRPSLRTDENIFAYNWSGRSGIGGLYGQTVGILGFGEIGVELARRLRPFAPAQVLYHKRRRLPDDVEAALGVVYAQPEALIAACDLLCVLLPYSPATDRSLNAATFAAMKPGTFLVHCGSGSVIDEAALAEALRRGHLAGAALDTFEWEPLRPDNPLLALARDPAANVLLTPHTAAATLPGGREGDWTNVRRVLAGEEPLNRVDK